MRVNHSDDDKSCNRVIVRVLTLIREDTEYE